MESVLNLPKVTCFSASYNNVCFHLNFLSKGYVNLDLCCLQSTALCGDFSVAEKVVTSHGNHRKLQVICSKVLEFVI